MHAAAFVRSRKPRPLQTENNIILHDFLTFTYQKYTCDVSVMYGSSKRPCIIIIFLSCFLVITTLFSRDLDITKVVLSLSRLNFSHYLDITKVVDLNVKNVFSRCNCSYREKIPHLVNVSGEYYGVRARLISPS